MVEQLYLEIAGIRIKIINKGKLYPDNKDHTRKYGGFIKKGDLKNPAICLEVKSVQKLPCKKSKRVLFEVRRETQGTEEYDWIIYKKGREFILERRMGEKYAVVLSQDLTFGKVYIEERENNPGWKMFQLLFGPLQIIIMHYLARHKLGVLAHSSGIRYRSQGFLFVGKTRAGKSTSARLWNSRKDVEVLNDDRIIIRKKGGHYYICGTPWHGDYSDYPETISASARLRRLFFIYHHSQNKLTPLKPIEAFNRFFPNTFPVFWDRESMNFTARFLCEVLARVPAFALGFVKERSAVDYVKNRLVA